MGLAQNYKILSSDILALKTRVKAEMNRRNGSTNLATGHNGNFSESASAGELARISQFNETVGYINLIKPTGITGTQNGLLYALQAATLQLTSHEQRNKQANNTDCTTGACKGLCYSTCTGGCRSGCTGGCLGSCDAECEDGCTPAHGGCSNMWADGAWQRAHY